jgi:flagellar biosynthesis GTPase FlhF
MRIERFDAADASRGIREINAKYGDDVLIITNARVAGKNQFVIAIDTQPKAAVSATGTAPASQPTVTSAGVSAEDLQSLKAMMLSGFADMNAKLKQLQLLNQSELQTQPTALGAWLRRNLREADALPEHPAVHVMVGGYGVGKTCAAARLASSLTKSGDRAALLVGYRFHSDESRMTMQAIADNLTIRAHFINDLSSLLRLIDDQIEYSNIIIEVPSYLAFSELQRMQQRMPFALFHLVAARDSQADDLRRFLQEARLKFATALITRIDCSSIYLPLLQVLIENEIPLLLGSRNPGTQKQLININKQSIIDEVIQSMMLNGKPQENADAVFISARDKLQRSQIHAEMT